MPFPLIPILALAGLGGGLYYLFTGDPAKPAKKKPISFDDRGYTVEVSETKPGVWEWRATSEGKKSKSGTAASSDQAISAAVAWISSRALPPAPQPEPEPAPESEDEPRYPLPPIPEPLPVEPNPLGWAGGRIQRSGLHLQGKTLRLMNLHQYVADAFGSFDAFADTPVDIVTKVLEALLPELGVSDARELELRLVNDAGDKIWVADAIERVGSLQARLLADDFDPSLVPFAEDILTEAIFGTEQRVDGPVFAFRGRIIYSRPASGGYRWSIRDANGVHGPSEDTFPTRELANQDAIQAIVGVDQEAA